MIHKQAMRGGRVGACVRGVNMGRKESTGEEEDFTRMQETWSPTLGQSCRQKSKYKIYSREESFLQGPNTLVISPAFPDNVITDTPKSSAFM